MQYIEEFIAFIHQGIILYSIDQPLIDENPKRHRETDLFMKNGFQTYHNRMSLNWKQIEFRKI